MRYTDEKNHNFTYSSFKERMYNYTNTLPEVTDREYTPSDSSDRYDLTYYSGSTKCVGEIKIRNITSTSFKTGFLEKQKVDSLLSLSQSLNAPDIHYQMFYTDGVCVVWNIRDFLHLPVVQRRCPETTANGKTNYVLKDVIELPVEQGMRFTYTIPTKQYIKQRFDKEFTLVAQA